MHKTLNICNDRARYPNMSAACQVQDKVEVEEKSFTVESEAKSTTPSQKRKFSSHYIRSSNAVRTPFKSPVQPTLKGSTSQKLNCLKNEEESLNTLMKQESELDDEICELQKEGMSEEELQAHIDGLHEYNDIKDVGQMLLGKLAIEKGITTKLMYEEYGLSMDD